MQHIRECPETVEAEISWEVRSCSWNSSRCGVQGWRMRVMIRRTHCFPRISLEVLKNMAYNIMSKVLSQKHLNSPVYKINHMNRKTIYFNCPPNK